MPRKFSFVPDEYHAPTIAELRHEWRSVPVAEARNVIAVENQYLDFHRYLIIGIRHQSFAGSQPIPLGLSLRAGSLKAASLICASIAEAALRAHAEVRGYSLPGKSWQRTFGRVLRAWQDRRGRPHADVAAVWSELQRLHSGRNNVHLYRAVERGSDFHDILAAEEISLVEGERILSHLKELKSEWRTADGGRRIARRKQRLAPPQKRTADSEKSERAPHDPLTRAPHGLSPKERRSARGRRTKASGVAPSG